MSTKTISLSTKNHRLMMRETVTSYMFLAPFLLFFIMFVVYPMFMCVYTSFFDATMNADSVFIGLGNYIELFQDKEFLKALRNTVVIVVVSVPVTCVFSLWVASAIAKMPVAATSVFRIIFYLPVVTGSVAVTMVWKWMYNNYSGLFNYIGTNLGLLDEGINWLGDPKYALGCIILILLTTSVGQPIVLYVSALDNVDKSLVEAAEVDGATQMQAFWRIKWPQIMPTTLYILVIHHQLLPVLCADPVVDSGRFRYHDHHVLHLLQCLQAVPLRLRQRNGCHSGYHHRHPVRSSVQAGPGI